jgi:protein-disulfide isomerase
MQRCSFIFVALTAIVLLSAPAYAADALTPYQKRAFEDVIRDYLLKNPEILGESMEALHRKREAAAQAQRDEVLSAVRVELEQDPSSPSTGNPDGDVTIVEFFDYQCGYCKQVFPTIVELLKTDGMIRYVFREFPILGEPSVYATRVSLAAWHLNPKKYLDFHAALMAAKGPLSEVKVLEIASTNGFDSRALKVAMTDPRIDATINRNYELAEKLRITGTPAFIVGQYFVPGAVDLGTLRKLVADARKK